MPLARNCYKASPTGRAVEVVRGTTGRSDDRPAAAEPDSTVGLSGATGVAAANPNGSAFLCGHFPRQRSHRDLPSAGRLPEWQGGRHSHNGVHRLRHSVHGHQWWAAVFTYRGVLLPDCDRHAGVNGSLLECHCQQRRRGKRVRLVQGPLGHLLANHAARVDGRAGGRRCREPV